MPKYYDATTFRFKDIFPDLDAYKSKVFPLLYAVDPADESTSAFLTYAYNLLYRRYANDTLLYDMEDAFVRQFSGILDDVANKYKVQKSLIDKVYQLDDEDLRLVNEAIVNGALNPNTSPADPRKPLPYVSNQSSSFSSSGKFIAYITAINALPTVQQGAFEREFGRLFRRYMTDDHFFYPEG